MKPRPFEFSRADTVEEAIALTDAETDGHFYAGGTELLLAMKLRVISPEHLIDVKRIPGLDRIRLLSDDVLEIGASSTHKQIELNEVVGTYLPSLAKLCSNVANVRVRGSGTLGGNLCFGEPHADPPTFLAALGATLCLRSAEGERQVAMDDFVVGEFETVREAHELLTCVLIPIPNGPVSYRRFKHGERPAVNCALVWSMASDGTTIRDCRVRVGALGSRPQALPLVEAALAGVRADRAGDAVKTVLSSALDDLDVISDRHGSEDYKRHIAGVLLNRNLEEASQVLKGKRA